jgi:hypothetical protein
MSFLLEGERSAWTATGCSPLAELSRGAAGTAAVKLGLEDGSKLRVNTTVVETDIHHPTDNTLLPIG